MSKLELLKKLKKEYLDRVTREGEEAVKETFKELFDKYPELRSVTWTEFTPYFNDGDVCKFSVNPFDVHLSEAAPKEWSDLCGSIFTASDSEYNYGETIYSLNAIAKSFPRLTELLADLKQVQKSMPEDLLEYIFGDHCQVIVTKEKIEVLEYEHN